MQHLSSGAYQVAWEPSRDNGAPLMTYTLEGRPMYFTKRDTNVSLSDDDYWDHYYNGTGECYSFTSQIWAFHLGVFSHLFCL